MSVLDVFAMHPWLATLAGLAAVALLALAADWLSRHVLLRSIRRVTDMTQLEPVLFLRNVAKRLAHIPPALVIHQTVALVPHLPPQAIAVARNLAAAAIVVIVVFALGSALNFVGELYQRRPDARMRPIKGYLQLLKILLYVVAVVLVVAVVMERSPLLLLSGLGALAAVLMLVFKDTILSLVASVQLTSNDMIRVGDWIEMPQLGADGDIVDIALHTVKVQNWDKTTTTIPTYRLITDSFRNWRSMSESGGRRIKRALLIDQNSVRFLGPEERERFRRIAVLEDYMTRKRREIEDWNTRLAERGEEPVNTRRETNLGTFRAYVRAYLERHPHVNTGMTLLVRQRAPTPAGLPLEIYCFAATTEWAAYEDIQSDIFDHLLSVIPEFGLRLFQEPSGTEFAAAFAAAGAAAGAVPRRAPPPRGNGQLRPS